MRRVLIALVSAVLLGGVALTTVASAHEGGEDLHYVAKATSVDKSDMGDSGKRVVVNFDLFDHDHDGDGDNGDTDASGYTAQDHGSDEPVGHGVAVCVTADVDEGVLCLGNIMVEDGQISSQGIIHMHSHEAAGADGDHHSVLLPITGGSGRFVGAAGELEISHAGGHGDGGDTGMHALGVTPADHGGGNDDGEGGKGHHGLHLTFHLDD